MRLNIESVRWDLEEAPSLGGDLVSTVDRLFDGTRGPNFLWNMFLELVFVCTNPLHNTSGKFMWKHNLVDQKWREVYVRSALKFR